jgi:hypothetical protein
MWEFLDTILEFFALFWPWGHETKQRQLTAWQVWGLLLLIVGVLVVSVVVAVRTT